MLDTPFMSSPAWDGSQAELFADVNTNFDPQAFFNDYMSIGKDMHHL